MQNSVLFRCKRRPSTSAYVTLGLRTGIPQAVCHWAARDLQICCHSIWLPDLYSSVVLMMNITGEQIIAQCMHVLQERSHTLPIKCRKFGKERWQPFSIAWISTMTASFRRVISSFFVKDSLWWKKSFLTNRKSWERRPLMWANSTNRLSNILKLLCR